MDQRIIKLQAKEYAKGGRNREERRRREKEYLKEAKKHANHQKSNSSNAAVR